MLLGLTYLVVMVALLAGPLGDLAYHLQSGFVPKTQRLLIDGGRLALAVGLSAFTHFYPLRRGSTRLETLS